MALPWQKAHQIGMLEAARASLQLGIDRSRRVDPFAALEAEGVLVMRRPLDHLAGIYLPADVAGFGRPGVLINANHPLSKQRYTAAHELAHHRRDREVILDAETEWIARGQSPNTDRERIAEAFAAWFLMPKSLVETIASRLGLSVGSLEPESAYVLALNVGASYAATVHHLANMRLLSSTRRDQLLRTPPQVIKRSIGALDVAADSWRDVWLLSANTAELNVDAQEGDAVVVEVPATPSNGYTWQPSPVPQGVSLVREEYRSGGEQEALGGEGLHRFMFRLETHGRWEVRLQLRRPWQQSVRAAEERNISITVEPKPVPGVVNPRQLLSVA